MSFGKENIEQYRREIQEILNKYGESKNLVIKMGPITYSGNRFTSKLAVVEKGEAEDSDEAVFNAYRIKFFVPKEWYGKKVHINGKTQTIVSLNPRARKNCIIIQDDESGKRYVSDIETIKFSLR